MGKGDKKTKRGKIIIGSSGVRRTRKKTKHVAPVAVKAEPKPNKEVEEQVIPPVKAAPKKSAKKVEEHVGVTEEKPKVAKTKKKAAGGEAEAAHEEPAAS
jgi:30S ribosomal protein S31